MSDQDMFAVFEGNDADTTHLERKASIKRAETKLDKATNLLLGYAEAEIRANPLDIVAYWLNADSRHLQSSNAANINCVRFECLERVNGHHSISFIRFRGRGVQDRTFLNSFVAKQVAENPPTYVVAVGFATRWTAESSDKCCSIWSRASRRIWHLQSESLPIAQRCYESAAFATSA